MEKTNDPQRSFWWTVGVILVAVCLMDFAVWYALGRIGGVISPLITSAPGQPEVTNAIQTFQSLEQYFILIGMPTSFLFFLILVGSIRMIYRNGNAEEQNMSEADTSVVGEKESKQGQAQKRKQDQRLFLHMISILQRKGRLIDFFAENLESYDDAQIGAAVREIHATCRGEVEKILSLKPVIGAMEGETVTVEPGFDPESIRLVGNVSGDPPFSGILRHRGWQAGKLEIPAFSGDQDPSIIAPAEVEMGQEV